MPSPLSQPRVFLLLLVLFPGIARGEDVENGDWLDPAGIDGTLLLAPGGVKEEIVTEFHRRLPRDPHVVVLSPEGERDAEPELEALLAAWKANRRGELRFVGVRPGAEESVVRAKDAISAADTIWLLGCSASGEEPRELPKELAIACRELLARKGRLAVCGEAVALAGPLRAGEQPEAGWGLLPDLLITSPETPAAWIEAVHASESGITTCELPAATMLLVFDRLIQASRGGKAVLRWPATKREAEKARELGDSKIADLTAVRRIARQRLGPPFPPEEPAAVRVENGTLIVIGGGGMPRGLWERFIELAGGENAKIVVLPTANVETEEEGNSLAALLRRGGAGKVTVLSQRTREEVESDEFREALGEATGVWFGGGRQWRFVDAYLDTAALPLMHDVLRRGGVIAGSSAGASIQGEYMARGDPLGNLNIIAEGYERGLGFLPGAAIDQHFTQRQRQGDMEELISRYPQLLGIGIDESTAIVVQGEEAEVVGPGDAYFYNGRIMNDAGGPTMQSLGAGRRYNLRERRAIPVEEEAEAGAEN